MLKRLGMIVLLILVLALAGGFAVAWKLPQAGLPQAATLFDRNGKEIKGLGRENQINLAWDQIPPNFIKAIIAMEDKNFYRHHGIDLSGIARAVYLDIKYRGLVAGGSTITQQTAKNLFLTNEKTFSRKIKELIFALELERNYSKDEILTMYCNSIYFGEGAYGIEMGARTFFGKPAQDLTLAEAALLAGLPRWPSRYDPYVHPEEARKRQVLVLERMVEEKMISPAEKEKTQQEKLVYKRAGYLEGDAPYFVALVKDYLIKKYGERSVFQGGLKVYTTLDLSMQNAANRAYIDGMQGRDPELQAALVALDVKNGQIRAMIGGRSFAAYPYNRVYARRQPGSTFKPFMYSLAVATDFTAASMFPCKEVEYYVPGIGEYRPTDYGDKPYHWRSFTLKEALMISDNVVAIQVNDALGPKNTAPYAEKFGFTGISPVLSLPLGSNEVRPLDLAAGYAVFADQGIYHEPYYILKVVDRNGKVLEENGIHSKKVIDADNAYIITDMLKGVMGPGGTGSGLRQWVSLTALTGKTGTTDEFRDAWFVGYTPRLCCAVWVGYDDRKQVNLTGSAAAGPIWARFMNQASAGLPDTDFVRPYNVVMENICLDSGQVASDACPRTSTMAFLSGTEPSDVCYLHRPDWRWWFEDTGQDLTAIPFP